MPDIPIFDVRTVSAHTKEMSLIRVPVHSIDVDVSGRPVITLVDGYTFIGKREPEFEEEV